MARPRGAAAVVGNVSIHEAVERAPVGSDIPGNGTQPGRTPTVRLGHLSPRRGQSQEVLLDKTPQLTSPPVLASVGALRAAFLPAKIRAWSRRILRTVGAGTRVKVVAATHLCVRDGSRSPVVATHQTLVGRHPLVCVRLFRCSVAGALPGANRVDHRAASRIEGVPHTEVAEELILRVNL